MGRAYNPMRPTYSNLHTFRRQVFFEFDANFDAALLRFLVRLLAIDS